MKHHSEALQINTAHFVKRTEIGMLWRELLSRPQVFRGALQNNLMGLPMEASSDSAFAILLARTSSAAGPYQGHPWCALSCNTNHSNTSARTEGPIEGHYTVRWERRGCWGLSSLEAVASCGNSGLVAVGGNVPVVLAVLFLFLF